MFEIDKLIEEGEKVREKKEWDKALEIFDKAIILSAKENLSETLVNILAQKLIVYKHLYYETRNELFLELFRGEVNTGLSICEINRIIGQPRAVMLVRLGDFYLLKQDYKKSVDFYKSATENLDESKKGEYGEYLGHLGFGQALSGDAKGFETFKKAYEMVRTSEDLRPFHKLVILSGIKLREAKSFWEIKDPKEAKISLEQAYEIAKILAEDHHLPLRLEEVIRLRKEFDAKS